MYTSLWWQFCSALRTVTEQLRAGARLQRLIPNSRRMILTNSGHAAMLETTVSVYKLLRRAQVLPRSDVTASEDERPSASSAQPANSSQQRNGSLQHVSVPEQQSGAPTYLMQQAANGADQGYAGAQVAAARSMEASDLSQSKLSTSTAPSRNGASTQPGSSTNGSTPAAQQGRSMTQQPHQLRNNAMTPRRSSIHRLSGATITFTI